MTKSVVLFLVATLLCSVHTQSVEPVIPITYGVYSDSACTNVVSTINTNSGVCTYNNQTGYSGILTVSGDLVTDQYFASSDCTGTGNTALYARDVCNPQGGSQYMKFSYTYQAPADTTQITYKHYTDTACTTHDYDTTIDPGHCFNNNLGFSGILFVTGDSVSDNYFFGSNCTGTGSNVSIDKDTCTPDGGTGSFMMTWSSSSIMIVPSFLMTAVVLAFFM